MGQPNYMKSLEWRQQFNGFKNVCFLPHKSFEKGMRERHVVHYPFARMIARGDLAKIDGYSNFNSCNVLVFCNLRPRVDGKTDVRPDILALSTSGDVLVVECKIRNKSEDTEEKAVKKLESAARQLVYYVDRLTKFTKDSQFNSWEIWENLHYNVYVKKHKFPPLSDILHFALSISKQADQKKWIEMINTTISKCKIKFGLAFNEFPDNKNCGYREISIESLMKASNGWNFQIGSLDFFGINHKSDSFSKRFKASKNTVEKVRKYKSPTKLSPAKESIILKSSTVFNQIKEKFIHNLKTKAVEEIVREIISWSKGKFSLDFRQTETYIRCVFVIHNTDPFWINTKGVIKFSRKNIQKLRPFDDNKLYKEFFNKLPKISTHKDRPSISLASLKEPKYFEELINAFDWFFWTVNESTI